MENIIDTMGGKLLSYGVSGFALLMIGFTYYLMRSELKRDLPRHIAIKTIWMFMGLVILSTVVVGFFSLPLANKNDELNDEVNGLTTDVSQLMEMLTKYEYALNDLAYKLDNVNKPNPTPPPKQDNGKKPTLNTTLLAKHVDFSKITIPKEYKAVKAIDLDAAKRKELKNAVQYKLNTNQFKQALKKN
ncbi:hypothetical protein [Pontimicrobium sp. MEBiC01747]